MKKYKVIEHFNQKGFEELLNKAALDGYDIETIQIFFARLGNSHQDHHTQLWAVLSKETE